MTELIRLVKSLSGPEKRNFKLYCKKQTGSKAYLDLFDIINLQKLASEPESVLVKFKKKHPGKSFENTAQYLLKIVTDSLVQIGATHDKWFQQFNCLMRSKVLFERSLSKEAYRELKKAQQLSTELQDNTVQYLGLRLELNYLSESGFVQMSEADLVKAQMKAKKSLRLLHQVQEHSSLYELLRFRLIHAGRSLSNNDIMKLNDLVISELSLITRGTQQNFESKKSHLLFQSFFLIHIGNYKSSLKSFYELNSLFENNQQLWKFPPFDYLYTLEGILDNLRTIKYYGEMGFYIKKIEDTLNKKNPEYFQIIARQTIYIYKLNSLINLNEPYKAKELAKTIPRALLKNDRLVDFEKRTELLFYIGLACFCTGDFEKANKQMSTITAIGKVKANSTVYKVSWLMQIIINYELDNLNFLDYQIRSYKRIFKKKDKVLNVERLILKLIKFDPKRKNKIKKQKFWMGIKENLNEVCQSNYEKQILKYFDFDIWIKGKLIDDTFLI